MIRASIIAAAVALAAGGVLADDLAAVAGKALFEREWIAAPASTDAADGLGPLFNAKSCNSCHKDGGAARFFSLDGKLIARGLVVRVATGGGEPHPRIGAQLQDRAVAGLRPEGKIRVSLARDTLHVDTAIFDDAGAVVEDVRIAPSLRGRGLLEQVDEAAILALADPDDADGDGISGRPRFLQDSAGRKSLGRFGYQADAATLDMQTASAAAIDLGLSSKLRPQAHGDCTAAQPACLAMATGRSAAFEGEEMSQEIVSLISGYIRSLRPNDGPLPAAGLALFVAIGCGACHRPRMPGPTGAPLRVFTDLLLHDLGAGTAGRIPSGDVSVTEWRTAPLLDLDPMNGSRRYLHDGRAGSIDGAIALHGGEAQRPRDAFLGLAADERRRLVEFLSGL